MNFDCEEKSTKLECAAEAIVEGWWKNCQYLYDGVSRERTTLKIVQPKWTTPWSPRQG